MFYVLARVVPRARIHILTHTHTHTHTQVSDNFMFAKSAELIGDRNTFDESKLEVCVCVCV